MKATTMEVDKISAVKLTRKGDNLAGTVSRTINYLSKHSNEDIDLVLLVGTNDLSTRGVSPVDIINKFDDSVTELKRFSNLNQVFLCKVPRRFDNHNINRKVAQFNELLVERFYATEDFISVIDTVQPEVRNCYQDGLHMSDLGLKNL